MRSCDPIQPSCYHLLYVKRMIRDLGGKVVVTGIGPRVVVDEIKKEGRPIFPLRRRKITARGGGEQVTMQYGQ